MSFPLIQEPSPMQQLAAVIQGLRQQAFERRMQMQDASRRDAYLNLNRAEFDATQQNRRQNQANTDRDYYRQVEQDKITQDQREQAAAERRGALHQDYINNLLAQGRAALPEGFTGTPQALLGIAKGTTDLSTALPAAQRGARPGLQGSATRSPVLGSANGITFDPGTQNYNAPSGGSGRGTGHIDQRVALGAGLMERIIGRANELYTADPTNAEVPLTGDMGAALVERVAGHGAGSRVADRVRNIGATQTQQEFRGLREQFKHSMAVFFPRVSIALMENLADSYFPVGGETGDAARAKMQALNDVGAWIARVQGGQASVQDLQRVIASHNPAVGSQFLSDDPVEPAQNTSGRPVGVPRAGNRFLR